MRRYNKRIAVFVYLFIATFLFNADAFAAILNVPSEYPTIQEAIDAAVNGDTILVAAGTYNEALTLDNKSGIILEGENRASIIEGISGFPVIYCNNITDNETVIKGFGIRTDTSGTVLQCIQCTGTVTSLRIEDNIFYDDTDVDDDTGIQLEDGASVVIIDNDFHNCAPLEALGNNYVEFIGNSAINTIGPNPPGISLTGSTALIKDNYLSQRWNGAIKLYGNSDATIVGNTLNSCYGWYASAGIVVYNSTAAIWNNAIRFCIVYRSSDAGVGLNAENSTVSLYNNIFHQNQGAFGSGRGVAINVYNANLVAKNNIICHNYDCQEAVFFGGTGTQDFSYNDLWDNGPVDTTGIILGPGNITEDPLFIDTSDFYLNPGSPCIDAGDPDPAFNDLDGTRNDMGIHGGPYGDMADTDQDGLFDAYETTIGTDPYDPDTDDDGVLDGEEVNLYATDPLDADSDDDGVSDGVEIENETDPNDSGSNPVFSRTITFDDVIQEAFLLSQQAHEAPVIQDIPALDPPVDGQPGSEGLVFTESDAITSDNLVIVDENQTYAYARPRAALDKLRFRVYTDVDNDGTYELRTYADANPNYEDSAIQPPINTELLPIAGKVLSRFIVGHSQPGYDYPQFFDFNSNGYVRFNGFAPQIVGSSYRIALHNVFEVGEDYPMFREIYFTVNDVTESNFMGIVDGEGFTGAVTMDLTPEEESIMHVTGEFFARRDILIADEPYTGLVGYSSMFWKDEDDTPGDPTDEAHDCDILVVGYDRDGNGLIDIIVEHEIENPASMTITDFETLQAGDQLYFALENRDRDPSHYSAYLSANYDKRSSYSIQLIYSSIPLSLILHETPTNSEYNDNIVINLAIKEDLIAATSIDDAIGIEYITKAYFPIDTDGDGLTDQLETLIGTDINDTDTDNDRASDYEELLAGTNPLKPPPRGCFLSGTPILMSDGTTKSIEKLKVGEMLLAYDEVTGELKPDTVKHVFVFPNEEEYLVINDNLKVTPHHAFYVSGNWLEAGQLKTGDTLMNFNGKPEKIASIKYIKENVTVYNLEVNPYHTFIAGGVVVHNAQLMQHGIIKMPRL